MKTMNFRFTETETKIIFKMKTK